MCRKRAIFSSFTASSSANTPKTSVRRNASGSISDRSTCDSAAKLTTASTPRMTSRTTFASQTSPCTNVYRESFARSARFAGFPAYVSLSRLTTRSSACVARTWRMKLEPMNPHPPVTRSFTSLPANDFPDRDARWDANQARGAGAEREAHARALGLRALPHVEQHQQHPIGRRHVPDVGLALVEVVRLDRAGLDLAVVDLAYGEAGERLGMALGQARRLGHAPAVVREPLELDDLDAVDAGRRTIGLDLKGALGGGREVHPVFRSYGSDSIRRNRYRPYELSFIGRAMRSTSSAAM